MFDSRPDPMWWLIWFHKGITINHHLYSRNMNATDKHPITGFVQGRISTCWWCQHIQTTGHSGWSCGTFLLFLPKETEQKNTQNGIVFALTVPVSSISSIWSWCCHGFTAKIQGITWFSATSTNRTSKRRVYKKTKIISYQLITGHFMVMWRECCNIM